MTRIPASEPTQTCELCGRKVQVIATPRGFPPDVAKRELTRACHAANCPCRPVYRAGVQMGNPRSESRGWWGGGDWS